MNDVEFVAATKDHIEEVGKQLSTIIHALSLRAVYHDSSKLREPEYHGFKECTEKLAAMTYGSEEYQKQLIEMQPFLDHHYDYNHHHPECFDEGIRKMNLIDIVEMFCDWQAATKRHNNGNILASIEINQKRFGYSDDLKRIFLNTAEWFKLKIV